MSRRLPERYPGRYAILAPHPALAHGAGHAWEQLALPILARRFAVLYSPANVAPAVARRNLVVIHDAAVLREPEAYSRSYVAFHSRLLRSLAARARVMITVSEFSRGELSDLLGVPAERFRVVPGGVGESFAPGASTEGVRRRYGLSRPYALSVATLSARKNLQVLDEAARSLRKHQIDLVLAGAGRPYMPDVDSPMRRLGYVPDGDLAALYAGALAFVMPSRYEGFGLPCLEAMACGVPVIAGLAGALPETVGDAAILVSPTDREAFADGLLKLIQDRELRARLVEKGLRRARQFSWERTAELTNDVVSELLS
ncbi:MAG: glycosyltransferase family 4 protein [Solirubrobacterales bacterium]|nr:glycosyltransferase family 4 protein [Solirubrobacterales bacterium]